MIDRSAAGAALVALLLVAGAAHADAQPGVQELKQLSIEQLMEIDVTLATRRAAPVGSVAAAISVITADDIRRAGVTTLADAVALADGVHVARFNNGTWAIAARGFNSTSTNKLLVMIDGRIEFSPLFAGVFWNMLDYVLEDVERIEVIRGPAATLWGANAVNGVINIVTRSARDSQGTFASIGGGNEDPLLSEVRYGGTAGGIAYRVYAKHARRDAQRLATGASAEDARRRGQAGFRLDGGTTDGTSWLVKGDAFHSREALLERDDGEFTGLALQAGLSRVVSPGSRIRLQSYVRREYRRVPLQLTHYVNTADFDVAHELSRRRHTFLWGAGVRVNRDGSHGGTVAFDPPQRTYPVWSAFAQDEIALRPDRLTLTAGVKLEHNAFSGAEWQPNVRARWTPTPRHLVWGAVARAVRRPTRLDADVRSFSPQGHLLAVGGGEAYDAETLTAGEVGYRVRASAMFSVDATAFVHGYDDLRSQELPPAGPPIVVGNTLNGRSRGVEIGLNVQPHVNWRSHVGYTYLETEITRDPESRDIGRGLTEANDPHHLLTARSALDLPRDVEVDVLLRGASRLQQIPVPGYVELGMRVAWRPMRTLELSVTGQDLLHDRHPEFGPPGPLRVEFERSVRALATVRLP